MCLWDKGKSTKNLKVGKFNIIFSFFLFLVKFE